MGFDHSQKQGEAVMIRTLKERFLGYHQARGFRLYESFPLVIDDPTILFTNATVTPFKPMFMGVGERKDFALVQKCLRLGGSGGNLDSLRYNLNHASLFEMLGSGLFDVGQDQAVAYFVDALTDLGLRKERLVFTALAHLGFDVALERAGVSKRQIRLFTDAKDIQHEWSFGEGDLHGCGVVARYVPEDCQEPASEDVVRELSGYVQIGRLVHIDGVARGATVEKFPYSAYDMGIGLNRVETALQGSCEESLASWRKLTSQLQSSMPGLSKGDAHYAANLYLIAQDLISEGLLPGKKKQAYVLRKVVRLLIEEIWLRSRSLVAILVTLAEPINASPFRDLLERVFSQEEAALREVLSAAKRKQKKYPEMGAEELRATFGIRSSLFKLV